MSAACTSDVHELAVADIAVDQAHGPPRHGAPKIFRPPPHHIIERNDFDAALVAQQVDDMRADKARPTRDQNAPTLKISQDALLLFGSRQAIVHDTLL